MADNALSNRVGFRGYCRDPRIVRWFCNKDTDGSLKPCNAPAPDAACERSWLNALPAESNARHAPAFNNLGVNEGSMMNTSMADAGFGFGLMQKSSAPAVGSLPERIQR